jgi:HEAT repeat protein
MMEQRAFEWLRDETRRFRVWADAYPLAKRHDWWAYDYRSWQQLGDAFTRFLEACPFPTWSSEAVQTVLYVIARDNESQHHVRQVAQEPARLLFLAEESLSCDEPDAKWQLAVELGNLAEHRTEAEPLLFRFSQDEDEYVRRQALMALGRLRSPLVERLVGPAWDSGDEYQRMAVLCALLDTASPELNEYLARADADGREYVAGYAARVRAGNRD